jgi:hypothetical protein
MILIFNPPRFQVYDVYIDNYSFLANSKSKEIFKKAGVPVIKKGLNDDDTPAIATKKGKQWGSTLSDTAKDHAELLRRKGKLAIDEQIYREIFADGLQAAKSATRVTTLQGLDWTNEKARAFFAAVREAFLEN